MVGQGVVHHSNIFAVYLTSKIREASFNAGMTNHMDYGRTLKFPAAKKVYIYKGSKRYRIISVNFNDSTHVRVQREKKKS